MTRFTRKTVIIGVAMLVMVALGAGLFWLTTYDWNYLKPRIAKEVFEVTGRTLTIGGDIDLRIGLRPSIIIKNVRLENSPWGSKPDLWTAQHMEIRVALLSLLSGVLNVNRLSLVDADLLIETDTQGRSNLPGAGETIDGSADAESSDLIWAVGEIHIENGHFTYRNGMTGYTLDLILEQGVWKAREGKGRVGVDVNGQYNGRPFQITGTAGTLSNLMDPTRRWTSDLKLATSGGELSVKGTLRDVMAFREIDLTIDARGRSLKEMGQFWELKGLPETKSYKVQAVMSAPKDNVLSFRGLDFIVDGSDLSGNLVVNYEKESIAIDANLISKRFDLRTFLPKNDTGSEKGGIHLRDKVFSSKPFPVKELPGTVIKLKLEAEELLVPRWAFSDILLHADLVNQKLLLELIRAKAGGGTVKLKQTIRMDSGDMVFKSELEGVGIDIGEMTRQLGMPEILIGHLDFQENLTGRGTSTAELMGSLTGEVTATMGQGRLYNRNIGLYGADLATQLFKRLNPVKERKSYTDINCMVVRLDAHDGQAVITALVIDTLSTTVLGSGSINLKSEELDLRLQPSPKRGVAHFSLSLSELTKPLKIGGTLANPSLEIDPVKSAILVGKAVGGILLLGPIGMAATLVGKRAGSDNPCVEALSESQQNAQESGDKSTLNEKNESVEKKKSDGVKGAVRGVGRTLKKIFGN